MFYVMNNDKLALFDDDLTKLQSTRKIMPQLTEETRETDIITEDELRLYPNKVIAVPNEYEVEVQDYETIYEEEQIPIYDENGEITGYETISVEKQVEAGTHTETRIYYTLALNPNFEEEQAQKEAERVAMLSLTKREVFLAIFKDKGITPEQIRAKITDTEALIEFDYAEKYYRGNPLINVLGASLGYTKEQLDYLFEFKSFAPVEASESDTGVLADE